jgi:AmmeMemoRadiSam system protein A
VSGLADADRAVLLRVARQAVRHRAGAGPTPEIPQGGAFAEARGVFVTLRRGDELRGCIGSLAAREPLGAAVAHLAASAASEDPRFEPVRAEEVDGLSVSVSVLSPLRRITGPTDLEVGRDGVVVQQGWHRGTLLPVVALEHGWTAEELLRHTCLKAGLPPGAWKEPDAVLEAYSAEELTE